MPRVRPDGSRAGISPGSERQRPARAQRSAALALRRTARISMTAMSAVASATPSTVLQK